MQEHVYLLTVCLFLATILLVFAMRYGAVALQARARQRAAEPDQAVLDSLAEIKVRLGNIEKILKDVE